MRRRLWCRPRPAGTRSGQPRCAWRCNADEHRNVPYADDCSFPQYRAPNKVDREIDDLRPVNTRVSSRTVQLPRIVVHLLEAKPRRMDGPRVHTGRDMQTHTIHPFPHRAFAAPHVWKKVDLHNRPIRRISLPDSR